MILPLEKQVANRELSQRLKELGFPQETAFVWCSYENPLEGRLRAEDVPEKYWSLLLTKQASKQGADFRIAAPTVAEMGEWLPDGTISIRLEINGERQWFCEGTSKGGPGYRHSEFADSDANARAKMVIYLLENNLISFKTGEVKR